MTTQPTRSSTATRPGRPPAPAPHTRTRQSTLTGTRHLVRFVLRRDRIRLPVWLFAILALVYGSAAAVQGLYDTQALRDTYASTMGSSPAVSVMSGPPTALRTLGGITVYEVNTSLMVALALMAIFLVVRHTRGEEELGRTELLRSTVVGRHAPTVAALVVVGGASVVVGAGVTAIMLGLGLPTDGSLAYGASVGALGVAFTAVAACAAQLTTHARGALGLASAFLGVAFVLRAAGDVGNGALSWLSPLGWVNAVRPFGDERWWPVVLLLGFAAAMLGLAAELTTHRDVGAGLVPPRGGSPHAGPRLGTATGLALRLQRGSLVGWVVGVFLGGVAFGSLSSEVSELVELSPEFADSFSGLGGSLVDGFLGTMLMVLALAGAGFTVSSVLRLRGEESAGRAEPLLATGLSRRRWATGWVTTTVVGTVLVALAGGLGVGLAHGVVSGDLGEVLRVLAAALAYVPAALVLAGVGVALTGWWPQAAMATWGLLAFCFVVGWLGTVLDFPAWLTRVSPYAHVPLVPAENMEWTPMLISTVSVVVLVTGGIAKLSNRDIA
jgi:ABC-2 type transport system permease protein